MPNSEQHINIATQYETTPYHIHHLTLIRSPQEQISRTVSDSSRSIHMIQTKIVVLCRCDVPQLVI